jgi:hypothetical protein
MMANRGTDVTLVIGSVVVGVDGVGPQARVAMGAIRGFPFWDRVPLYWPRPVSMNKRPARRKLD